MSNPIRAGVPENCRPIRCLPFVPSGSNETSILLRTASTPNGNVDVDRADTRLVENISVANDTAGARLRHLFDKPPQFLDNKHRTGGVSRSNRARTDDAFRNTRCLITAVEKPVGASSHRNWASHGLCAVHTRHAAEIPDPNPGRAGLRVSKEERRPDTSHAAGIRQGAAQLLLILILLRTLRWFSPTITQQIVSRARNPPPPPRVWSARSCR